jgi:two-component system sensor histidine kinase AdeS
MQGLAEGVYEPSQDVFRGLIGHIDALTRIVDDLKTLSLMNAGRMELDYSRFDLAAEVADIIASATPTLANCKIDVETSLERVILNADRARIRQALLALMDNVGRYAPGSKLEAVVKAAGDTCLVSISDNGPGMTGTEREYAFERFWRADEARTRRTGGSGLGLSVVEAIAEAHGGRATIECHEGGGTKVTVAIPLG